MRDAKGVFKVVESGYDVVNHARQDEIQYPPLAFAYVVRGIEAQYVQAVCNQMISKVERRLFRLAELRRHQDPWPGSHLPADMIEAGGNTQPSPILIGHKIRADLPGLNLRWIGKHGWDKVSVEAEMDNRWDGSHVPVRRDSSLLGEMSLQL